MTATRQEPAALVIAGLTVTYATGAQAVSDVTLTVEPGTVVAVLGRNGAGKTSLLRGLSGFLPSERVRVKGSVRLGDRELAGGTPQHAYRHGVVLLPERDKVFPNVSVADHMRLVGVRRPEDIAIDGFDAIARRWESRAGLLSGGERQMLALAMAWAHRPRVLLIDELSLGLAPVITKRLLGLVQEQLAATGGSVIAVEQDANAAVSVSDHVYVIDRGEIVWSGASAETSAETLENAYLGGVPS
jgi:ABC-type branched-subunit amino acid transport system ATPase component